MRPAPPTPRAAGKRTPSSTDVRSSAATPDEYISQLEPGRAAVIGQVRDLINRAMPDGYVEGMGWGMITWSVPLERYPDTYNGEPLAYAALAAQKNYNSLYLNCVYTSRERTEAFKAAFAAAGKKLDMGKSCIRFQRAEDLAEDVIAAEIAAVTPDQFIRIYETARSGRRRLLLVEVGHEVPGSGRVLAPVEQLEVARRDHAFLGKRLEIDHPGPELAAEQQDRQRPHLAGLDQGQRFEEFVERAEPAGEHRDRPGAQQEVHLAKREIVELEAEVRGHIGVGQLLVRKHDVEADALLALVAGAAVGGFHHRRPAARADDELPPPFLVAVAAAGEPRQLAGDVVIARLRLQPLGDQPLLVVGRRLDQSVGQRRLRDPRRAVEDEHRADLGFVEEQLRLQQLELEAHRAQVRPKQEVGVLEGELVGFAFGLRARGDVARGARVDLGRSGKCLAAGSDRTCGKALAEP